MGTIDILSLAANKSPVEQSTHSVASHLSKNEL